MKIKYLFLLVIVFSVFLGVSLLSSEDIPLKVISSPKIYSMKHTELNESFRITMLMNRNDTYHLDTTYIRKSSIKNGEEHLPVSIDLIEVSNETIVVEDELFYVVNFITSLRIESNDHSINYDYASLEIEYENDKVMDVYIGELNYLFKDSDKDLSLYNLQGTFGKVNGINTVTGVAIELMNKSNRNITIKRIDIVSNDVSFNNDYLIEKDREIDMFEVVEDILLLSSYDFDAYESLEQHHSILSGQKKKLYIPVLYNSDIKYISRFVIMVTYEIDGIEQTFYVDDFIFMNRLNYGPEFASEYVVYEYES